MVPAVPEYQFIDRQHQLDLAVSTLSDVQVMGIDTESSGYYTYFSELCLIQITAGGRNYIIDALAGLDLSGLGRLFASPGIVKVFHAAASDIGELRRDLRFDFTNVFDTMMACRLLGHEGCSLSALVKKYHGVDLEKKEQKSNWKKRPLTRSQLEYACLDTVYLQDLREVLLSELRELELEAEITEEFDRVARLAGLENGDAGERPAGEAEAWLRVRGVFDMPPIERGRIKQLYNLRDQRARKENIAAFRLITNDAMAALARRVPANLDVLRSMRSAHPLLIQKDGARILEALRSATPVADDQLPLPPEEDPAIKALVRRLRRWRTRLAEYRGIDPALVVSNRALFQIASRQPVTLAELAALDLMTDWKLRHYGEQLLQVLHGSHTGELPTGLARLPEDRRLRAQEKMARNGANDAVAPTAS